MLENNSDNLKRFGPPSQRNRSLNRRKSGDVSELHQITISKEGCSAIGCILPPATPYLVRRFDSWIKRRKEEAGCSLSCTLKKESNNRFEKTNFSHGIDGDKSQSSIARSFSSVDLGDTGSSYIQNESTHIGLVALDGCSTSEAAQLLNERWAATMHSYNDQSIDLSERPIMYSGASGTSWGHLKLPHQMDFAAELRRAIHNAQPNVTQISGGQG